MTTRCRKPKGIQKKDLLEKCEIASKLDDILSQNEKFCAKRAIFGLNREKNLQIVKLTTSGDLTGRILQCFSID